MSDLTMDKSVAIPARLYVLYSKASNTAVILRKGPSKWTLSLGWDLVDDTFSKGQWLLGKIYNEDCAISNDGQYWFYSAYKKDGYSAIAKVPYLKSLFYRNDLDRWREGGRFDPKELKADIGHNGYYFDPDYLAIMQKVSQFFEKDQHLFESQMSRRGWKIVDEFTKKSVRYFLDLRQEWQLRLLGTEFNHRRDDGGVMTHIYELCYLPKDYILETSLWEWADYDDLNDRLIWAEMGKIMTAKLTILENGLPALSETRCLLDTNDMQFEELIAPY
ncbi:hypothetical protein MMG00_04095 [Ignatzschineria rhizosphaerae]|uniref:Uncharacterized protein n=1 Tax=Ignatzschineria rhizosphaerae TaxID=2923279 RepID=A0ABY3X7L2_9GAMM|nr:hypothetical protein [Ignatzschineria rhizosphaerae]UNM97042.1 hypothetical protein MMG00_04095 [Ignatzschineria rhizosphaerae]